MEAERETEGGRSELRLYSHGGYVKQFEVLVTAQLRRYISEFFRQSDQTQIQIKLGRELHNPVPTCTKRSVLCSHSFIAVGMHGSQVLAPMQRCAEVRSYTSLTSFPSELAISTIICHSVSGKTRVL